MARTVFLIAGAAVALILVMAYPFLPGAHDAMALPLSVLVQVAGLFGMPAVPVGMVWLIQRRRGRRVFRHAVAAICLATLAALAVAGAAALTAGFSFGLLVAGLWSLVLVRWVPRVRALCAGERGAGRAPLCLVTLAPVLLLAQILLLAPLTDAARARLMAGSGQLIADIEHHRTRYGSYPLSLQALNRDYDTSVTAVLQYHYVPRGQAYSVYFAQPRFLLDEVGVREIVMYNPRDEHLMPSHVYWILYWSPEQLERNQGWFAVRDTGVARWKAFVFD
ncbi:hypothetical protein [Nonomuraea typhae]|uniref:hypothetical protein n=1 Tax=Nonomuraea typhae TaxID=2603600 RepID=UPI0012FC9197|nr:hypothetical protein [Nonomuraea typhae]